MLDIDGVLYVKIVNPYNASYGVENAIYAVMQLAQTTMRSELGKITLDKYASLHNIFMLHNYAVFLY